MTIEELRSRIAGLTPQLKSRLGVAGLFVFGSVARGEARQESDIDVLVDFEGGADFDRFMTLKERLEAAIGCPVDLVTRKALRPEMRPQIEREAVRVV